MLYNDDDGGVVVVDDDEDDSSNNNNNNNDSNISKITYITIIMAFSIDRGVHSFRYLLIY